MQSSNPVFARSAEFNGRGGQLRTSPSQWQIDLGGSDQAPYQQAPSIDDRRMTVDTVVEKTGLTLLLVAAAAAVTWFMIGDISTNEAVSKAFTFAMGGAIIGLVLSLVNSFKKVISPALVLAYAVFEGVFVGAFSKIVASWAGDASIVFQAVLGTIVAFAATLAAYKFFNIQVTDKFRKVVTISVFAFAGAMLVNFVLSLLGVVESGLRSMGPLGLLVSAVAIVLAVFMLILDFDFVEQGVRAGLPERESWRAAFGLTVTLVWLYLEILRLLMILRGDD